MLDYKEYLAEVSLNAIGRESAEKTVTGNTKYNSATEFKKNAKPLGKVGPLEVYSSENSGGGISHFTYHPQEKTIHHVVHAVEKTETKDGKTRLKYLSAHGRKKSPVRMGQIYSHLVQNHDREFVATGHSVGAKKMWDKFHDDKGLKMKWADSGETVKSGERIHGDIKSKNPEERALARRHVILTKAD